MKKKPDGTEILLNGIVKGIFEKKGQDVLKIDLRKLENRITDYFVICHGSSTTQVESICDSVEEAARQVSGAKPNHRGTRKLYLGSDGLRRCGCACLSERIQGFLQSGDTLGGRVDSNIKG